MTMPRKKHFPPTETPLIVAVKKLLVLQAEQNEKRQADLANYLTGALEQLMMQQGQEMTVQAAIIEYLEELSVRGRHDVFAETRIKSIVEQNISRMKAEREARDAKLAEEAAKRKEAAAAADQVITDPAEIGALLGSPELADKIVIHPPVEISADIAPEAPADAPADSPGSA